jgi:predicted RNA-binding Zn-ribbon protein involved in translation (DUF1610 family)
MWELECPRCDWEFEAQEWYSDKCPKCGNEYYFGEDCTSDYSDCWTTVEWESYKKETKSE